MNGLFLGQYHRSVDVKGRVAIPSNLRASLGPGSVLTRSFDGCLSIYPASKWNAMARSIDDLPDMRYEARSTARALFSSAVPCTFDRQGRLSIPVFLRDHAGLHGDDAVVVGVGGHVEIWSRSSWLHQHETLQSEGRQLAEGLAASRA